MIILQPVQTDSNMRILEITSVLLLANLNMILPSCKMDVEAPKGRAIVHARQKRTFLLIYRKTEGSDPSIGLYLALIFSR